MIFEIATTKVPKGAIALSYPPIVIDDSSWKNAAESFTVALTLTLRGVRKCNSAGFWLCCESILFSISSELRFVKSVRFFERSYIVKWVIFFASFCWLWDFLLENQKLTKNSGNVHWNVWTNIKSCIPETKIIFPKKKKEFQIWDFESFIFWFSFRFLGDCFRAF